MNYRVLFVPAIEKFVAESFNVMASSKEEAQMILKAIADYTLYLQDKGLMCDYSNFGAVEQFVNGEWLEVEDNIENPEDDE